MFSELQRRRNGPVRALSILASASSLLMLVICSSEAATLKGPFVSPCESHQHFRVSLESFLQLRIKFAELPTAEPEERRSWASIGLQAAGRAAMGLPWGALKIRRMNYFMIRELLRTSFWVVPKRFQKEKDTKMSSANNTRKRG